MIAPPSHRLPDAAEVQVLFAEARRRRWRRRLAAGLVSLLLVGLAVAVSIGAWSHQPRRGSAHAAHPPAAAQRVPGFSLPPATVAWVDYSGRLHIGDVAALAQHVAGSIPAWAGAGWLVQAGGTRLAVFERTASINSSCCASNSVLAIVNTRTGAVRAVRAARLVTEEDAGWILWLPGGRRLLAGALSYSYAVDTTTYAARPFFFFFPQTADGPDADHNIMDTPDINFSTVLLPSVAARPAASAAPGSAALVRDRAVWR